MPGTHWPLASFASVSCMTMTPWQSRFWQSFLWSAGDIENGRQALEALQLQHPAQVAVIQEVIADLMRSYPAAQ
jgi:hypothetical protein